MTDTNLSNDAKEGKARGEREGLDFVPNTDSDHRNLWDWKSGYPKEAQVQIGVETLLLLIVFLSIPLSLGFVAYSERIPFVDVTDSQLAAIKQCAFAFLGGLLGGSLFDMKWLYHSVANGKWHQDRALWRLLTPFISAGLAFAFFIMIKSNIFKIFDPKSVNSLTAILGISFLVGYFSDSALAKMKELATTLFGVSEKPEKPAKQ